MPKIIAIFFSLLILSSIFLPFVNFATATDGIVQCDGVNVKCDEDEVIDMLQRILSFIVRQIATPLAILAITVGGIMMVISSGNPGLAATGKKVVFTAVIGLLLAWSTQLVINTILEAIGSDIKITQ